MTRMTCIPIGLALLLAVQTAWAGDVALEVSAREVSVNEPVTVQIRVINAERHDPPEFPEIPGAVVRSMGTPTRSSQTSIINGRMTQQTTMIYSYRITPRRAGKIAIPPIAVRVDGRRLQTAATTILVTDSGVETTDLLFLDLVADRDTVYLGESINVDLEIWVRPYRDGNVRMDPEQMLSRIDLDGSQWGAFRDTIIRLQHGSPGFRWRYREAVRADSTGTDRAYYVFVVPLEFVPTTTGPLDVGDVDVVVSYPTQTGRSRDIFFSVFDRYQVTRARPIAASLDESEITVLAPPAEGQPEYFNGAVGNYQFTAKAGNTDVRVREPIELTLTITGDGVLDRVSPPPLNQVEELTRDFKVPTENIAGVVEQNSKRFTMKISAKHADVTEIPAIPFSFFQPQAQRYVTLWSDPIPLDVEASDQVSLAQFAESANGNRTGQAKLTETAVGIRANYGHMDDVLAQQAFDPGWGDGCYPGRIAAGVRSLRARTPAPEPIVVRPRLRPPAQGRHPGDVGRQVSRPARGRSRGPCPASPQPSFTTFATAAIRRSA